MPGSHVSVGFWKLCQTGDEPSSPVRIRLPEPEKRKPVAGFSLSVRQTTPSREVLRIR